MIKQKQNCLKINYCRNGINNNRWIDKIPSNENKIEITSFERIVWEGVKCLVNNNDPNFDNDSKKKIFQCYNRAVNSYRTCVICDLIKNDLIDEVDWSHLRRPDWLDAVPGDVGLTKYQIITGNIDELIGFPVADNEFVTYGTWWPRNITANGGFYKFKSGQFDYIWNDFSLNPEYWQTHYYEKGDVHYKYYGEQNYVDWKLFEKGIKVTQTPKEWLGKYTDNKSDMIEMNKLYSKLFKTDYMILDKPNDMIKVVHMNGVGNTIHKYNQKFIKDNWHG